MRLRKGSPEAMAWAERMRRARALKIRRVGRHAERKFFGPGAPLDPRTRGNPSASRRWVLWDRHLSKTSYGNFVTKRAAQSVWNTLEQEFPGRYVIMTRREASLTEMKRDRRNPGERWHRGMAQAARRMGAGERPGPMKYLAKGMEVAHTDSADAAKRLGMNPKDYPNIEKSAFKRGEYVGYGNGVWRIFRWGSGWRAVKREGGHTIDGATLGDLSEQLAHEAAQKNPRRTRKNPLAVYGLGNPPRTISATVEGIIYKRCLEIRAEKLGWKPGLYRHPFSRSSSVQVLALSTGDLLIHSTKGKRLWSQA